MPHTAPALPASLRVVVADDHAAFRQRLAATLTAGGMDVVGVGANGAEALALARQLDPDVAVLDLRMPALSGAEVARALQDEHRRARVVIVSGSCEPEVVLGALRSGAAGFVPKDASRRDLLEAVARAAAGSRVVPPSVDAGGLGEPDALR